jgi:hypothetical protein
LIVLLSFSAVSAQENSDSGMMFSVTFSESVSDALLSGRMILLLSRTDEFDTDGYFNGTPMFGINVDDLAPETPAVIDESAQGDPLRSIREIPAGEYYVKAYLNVYTTFHKSDGYTVKLHMDQGEGQQWRDSPGNLFSETQKIYFDPHGGDSIEIVMDRKIPPILPPQDTEWVKNITVKSELVAGFWGRDMFISARVLLPKGFYEHPEARYPVVYQHGHFSRGNPGGFLPPENGREGNGF